MKEREYIIGVFTEKSAKGYRFNAYSRDYNPRWRGCCQHFVIALNGNAAKREAVDEHRSAIFLKEGKCFTVAQEAEAATGGGQ